MARWLLLVTITLTSGGCSFWVTQQNDSVSPPIDGGVVDGGRDDGGIADGGIDGGVVDGGTLDAGPAADAGRDDAGETDAGPTDGGDFDAGPTDGGLLDGGNHDGGIVVDGGVLVDGGVVDAGVEDAGVDAGPLTPFLFDVTVGYRHACAQREDRTWWCWGLDNWGAASGVDDEDVLQQVSAGSFYTCGVGDDGAVRCWGELSDHEDGYAADAGYAVVRAGETHSCAVRVDGAVECHGDNGDGAVSDVPAGPLFADVDVGLRHACALTSDTSTAVCWGDDTDGKVTTTPATAFVQVVSGWNHNCGRASTGEVSCWGAASQTTSTPADTFSTIDAEHNATCGVTTSGALRCWGAASQVVDNVPAGTHFATVDVGTLSACALSVDGRATCWGSDSELQASGAPVPTPATFASTMGLIGNAVCARDVDGNAVCYGNDGLRTARMSLLQAAAPGAVFSVGHQHACGLLVDGSITCAGSFDGDGEVSAVPAGVFVEVAVGRYVSCARHDDDTVVCWGRDDDGVVSGVPAGTFAQLRVSARGEVACARQSGASGSLVCWGATDGGVVGNVPAATDFVAVDVGTEGDLACGIHVDGSVTCWGNDATAAVPPPPGVWSDVSVGAYHVCARADDGATSCWADSVFVLPQPPEGLGFVDVTSEDGVSCGVSVDGDLWCFGSTFFSTDMNAHRTLMP